MIITESLLDQPGDLVQQPVNGQDRGDAAPHLADDAELLRPPLLGIEEARVLDGDGCLVG